MDIKIPAGRINLCAYAERHIEPLHAAVLASIPELPTYETWAHAAYSLEEAAQYVNWWRQARDRKQAYYFAVEECDTGRLLGSCGISDLLHDHHRAGLGFWIRQDFTNQGYATEAAKAVLALGFRELELNRIELEIAVNNQASRRVAEKLGTVYEGTLRQRLFLPAGPVDTAIYSALRDEWLPLQQER